MVKLNINNTSNCWCWFFYVNESLHFVLRKLIVYFHRNGSVKVKYRIRFRNKDTNNIDSQRLLAFMMKHLGQNNSPLSKFLINQQTLSVSKEPKTTGHTEGQQQPTKQPTKASHQSTTEISTMSSIPEHPLDNKRKVHTNSTQKHHNGLTLSEVSVKASVEGTHVSPTASIFIPSAGSNIRVKSAHPIFPAETTPVFTEPTFVSDVEMTTKQTNIIREKPQNMDVFNGFDFDLLSYEVLPIDDSTSVQAESIKNSNINDHINVAHSSSFAQEVLTSNDAHMERVASSRSSEMYSAITNTIFSTNGSTMNIAESLSPSTTLASDYTPDYIDETVVMNGTMNKVNDNTNILNENSQSYNINDSKFLVQSTADIMQITSEAVQSSDTYMSEHSYYSGMLSSIGYSSDDSTPYSSMDTQSNLYSFQNDVTPSLSAV